MQMPPPAAARAPPPGSLSWSSFLAPSPHAVAAATTVRLLGRRGGAINRAGIRGGVAPRSGRRDGEWGADPDPSTGTGRMVDADMATLRRRIREARAALSEDDDIDGDDDDAGVVPVLPGRWTELERRHDGSRVARIVETLLVNARPGLGAGVLAMLLLLLLGVPASAFLLCNKLVQEWTPSRPP
ncbi:hypothetical protein PR202_ga05674 [Eleusine coracana subsp. coracana]|uniref:Uncharacterized protein n=1 Tax=Eleusine coracana subsp. coracana TaxID=191504 RepID=A0AAV5BU25_ELECO|nr:hypothetical protein PR202_ga05220 [Eleusine coracana subsp. coracana]GJM89477.1 hypothetical protein PR202_ga05674 [Eleusine coracana subsp. coracana]